MTLSALAVVLVYLEGLGTLADGATDIRHLLRSWTLRRDQVMHFVVEMLLLFQLFPLVLALPRSVLAQPLTRLTALVMLALLAATWFFRLPAVPRLYLPVLVLITPLAAIGLRRLLEPRLRTRVLCAYLGMNYGICVVALFAGV